MPAEALFQNPVLGGAQLSPDGRFVALKVGGKDKKAVLAVLDLSTMQSKVVASFSEFDVGFFRWVNDRRLVFNTWPKLAGPGFGSYGQGLFAVDADGSRFRQLVETEAAFVKNAESGTALLKWSHQLYQSFGRRDSDHVFVVNPEEMSKQRIGYFVLRRLNTVTGVATDVDAPLHATDWLFDEKGALKWVVTQKDGRRAVVRRDGDERWTTVAEFDLLEDGVRPAFIDDRGVLYGQGAANGRAALFRMDAATGKLIEPAVVVSETFDLYPSPVLRNGTIIGWRIKAEAERTIWQDPALEALQAQVDKLLSGASNVIEVPERGDSPYVLIHNKSDRMPTRGLLLHRETGKLTLLGSSHPQVNAADTGRTEFVTYVARDGRLIPAWITAPPGAKQLRRPMVVLVHGGPWVRGGGRHWDPEVQFLASRGYVVVQPEFRGSTGFGRDHFKAGFKQWGKAMQTDLADAASWAIKEQIADPERICIMGASYGGYATLMGLAQNPELFKCGVAWVGVTDPMMLFDIGWSDVTSEAKTYGYMRLIGDPATDREALKRVSPLHNADQIKQPLLLAYGKWDVRVPIVHGERFRDAIKPHNKNAEWIVYPDQGHGWDGFETKSDFWGRVERLLQREIGENRSK